jgi:hypothetical protein
MGIGLTIFIKFTQMIKLITIKANSAERSLILNVSKNVQLELWFGNVTLKVYSEIMLPYISFRENNANAIRIVATAKML